MRHRTIIGTETPPKNPRAKRQFFDSTTHEALCQKKRSVVAKKRGVLCY